VEAAFQNRVRVGAFELDLKAGELRSEDRKVRLQEQPFQILLMLVERSGGLVTREEIQKKLWPNDTVVEFDHSIHTAIKKLRQAFGDSAEHPKYIETVARRGYRLMVLIERMDVSPPSPPLDVAAPLVPEPSASSLTGAKVSHYRVLEVMGGGGMGIVYKAEDLKLGRRVALKFLPEELGNNAKVLERFEREARAASALDHPNICAIYEFGEHEGRPFIAMPLLEGQTLRDRIAARAAPFTTDELLKLAIQIGDGLAAADEKGIIHRDIKPANIFITNRDEAKILDFGLAKLTHAGDREGLPNHETQTAPVPDLSLSVTGVAMGTAPYMSPEQVRGEKLDARTDLFSLGLVIYEMATGKQAFRGGHGGCAARGGSEPYARPGAGVEPGSSAQACRDHQQGARKGPRSPLQNRRGDGRGPGTIASRHQRSHFSETHGRDKCRYSASGANDSGCRGVGCGGCLGARHSLSHPTAS
jgi:DNA-binding winged helix-turn-helix (wHTH) protein